MLLWLLMQRYRMPNEKSVKRYTKVLLAGLAVALSAAFLTPLASTTSLAPAFANGGCGGPAGFGCDAGAGTVGNPPVQSTTPPPSQGGNTGGGGGSVGGGGTVRPNLDWKVAYGDGSACPRRDDGKAAIRTDYYYKKETAKGESRTVGPAGFGWTFSAYIPGYGYYWDAWVYQYRECRYPPRTYTTTATCILSSYGTVNQLKPRQRVLDTKISPSAYTRGSGNIDACRNSKSVAWAKAEITERGYYTSTAVSTATTVTILVPYTPDETTGVTPAPYVIAETAPYPLSPKAATGTQTCHGWNSPALPGITDWSDNPCGPDKSNNPTFQCVAPQVLFDKTDANGFQTGSHPSNSMQFMRDGEPKFIRFNQGVTGSGITVKSYKTTFYRSGTPWDSSKSYYKNLFDLSLKANGPTILTQESGSRSKTFDGRVNEVFHRGYSAGVSGKPTVITQRIDWSGTRTMASVKVIGTDGRTGQMLTIPITVQIPTSGTCQQSVSLEYIRAIGDAVR